MRHRPRRRAAGLAADSGDDMFLACAEAASADYLVTGDNDLLTLERIGKTRILPVRAFLDETAPPPEPPEEQQASGE